MRKFTFNSNIVVYHFPKVIGLSLLLIGLTISPKVFGQTQTYSVNGTFTAPAGLTSVQVQAWGGGGAGGGVQGALGTTRAAGGGAGGSFTNSPTVTVIPGNTVNIIVGIGGVGVSNAAGGSGGTSSFGAVSAIGGAGGARATGNTSAGGGTTAGVTFNGGAGGTPPNNTRSGAGGGGAGSSGVGTAAAGVTAGAGGAGGGGTGGGGVTGSPGAVGGNIGGGGSGARVVNGFSANNGTGGNGAAGQVAVIYNCPIYGLSNTVVPTSCQGSGAVVTLTGASLPNGSYTVNYSLSGGTTVAPTNVSMTVTGGTGTFTTATLTGLGNTNVKINSIGSGASSLSAAPLCVSTLPVSATNNGDFIVVTTPATPGTIAGTATVCAASIGNAYNISAVTYATSYTWTVPAGWNITSGQGTNAITATAGGAGQNGNITVTATNSTCNTTSAAASFPVSVVTIPATPGVITGAVAVCPNTGGITYTVAPVTYANSYTWTIPVGWSTLGSTTNSITVTSGNIADNGDITVTATNATCGTSASQTLAVIVPSAPLDFSLSGDNSICEGTSTTVTLSGSETGVNYELRDAANALINTAAGSGSSISLSTGTVNSTTTFHVVAVKVTGCGVTMTGTATITITPGPDVDAISNVAVCNTVSVPTITFTSTPSGSTFTWTNSNTAIGLVGSGSGDISSFVGTNGTNAAIASTVTVTAFDGACYSAAPQKTFTITINPTPTVTNNATYSTCSETGPNIALTSNTPSSFTWIIGNITGGITGASDAGGNTINQVLTNPSDATPGTVEYIVTPTSTVGTCPGATFTITVTVNPKPNITTANTASICSGTGPGIGLVASAASNFAWTLGTNVGAMTGGTASSGAAINQTLTNPSNSTAGSLVYNLTATTTVGTCLSALYPITVTVNPRPAIVSASTPNTKAICSGENTNITLIASTASSFAWTLGTGTGSSISGANAGSGTTIGDVLTNPTNNTAGTVVYNVTPTANGCDALTPYAITVTVRPLPVVTNAAGYSLCSGSGTARTLTASVASTYTWTIGANAGGITGATGSSAAGVTAINQTLTSPSSSAAAAIEYIVTPTANTGSCVGAPFTITFNVNPTPVITTAASQSVCAGDVTNIALTASATSTFSWLAGLRTNVNNGTTPAGSGSTIAQTPTLQTTTTAGQVIYRVTATAGTCPSAQTNITLAVNPRATISNATTAATCSGISPNINFAATPASTYTYAWTLGTNTGGITGGADGAGPTISDVLVNPSHVAGAASLVYNVTPTSTITGCPGNVRVITVTVRPAPAITNATSAYSICSATSPAIALTSSMTSTYSWVANVAGGGITGSSNGTGTPINQILTNPSDATAGTVEYIVTPTSTATGTCVGTPFPFTVAVNPTPTIGTATSASICSGTAPGINLTSSAGSDFAWTLGARTNVSGGIVGNGTTINDILTNTTNNVDGSLIYNVTATTTTGTCPSAVTPITVTVTPTPVVTNPNIATACNGTSPNIGLTASTPSSFVWTVGNVTGSITGATAGSGTTGAATIADVLNNPSNSVSGTVEYIITPTSNTNGCLGAPYTITVTVFPTPEVNSAPTANACSSIPQIPLNYDILGTASGTTFTWGRLAVSGVSEGTVAGQTADPILETLTNTTAASIPVIYKITPSANGCPGPVFDLVVTVMPRTDAVVNSAASATICTPAAINYTITSSGGPVTGYRWSRQAVSGITNSSVVNATSNPIIETLTNGSIANATVTYAITAMNNGCPGDVFNYVVTVRPTLYLSNQTFEACSLQEFIFGPADASSGVIPEDTKFTWSAPVVTGGITGGSAQSTPQDSVFQTLTNPTGVIKTATYIVSAVSPTACVGGAFQLTVNVNPSVTVNASPAAPSPACSGSPIPTILVTSPTALPGTVLSWTRINTANLTGMGATGNGDISGTLVNNTSTDQVETFTITAEANGCVATTTVDITIRPAATVTVNPASQTACSGESIASIILSSPVSTSFTWNRDNLVDITGLASGSGDIIGSLVNTTNSQKTTIFTITPALASCNGVPITAAVIVNPTPQVTASRNNNNPVCSGQPIEPITVASLNTVIGTVFSWTRNNTTDITGNNSGTGALINEVFVNTTNVPQTTTITITATAGTCSSNTTMDVLVNPSPTILVSPAIQAICSGSGISTITLSDNLASTYSVVSRDNTTSVTGTITGSTSLTGVLTNATTTTQITNLSVTATASASGNCAATATIPVTVYAPLTAPAISESQYLCTGVNPSQFSYGAAPSGGSGLYTYQWQKTTPAGTVWTDVATTMNYTATLANSNADYRVIAIDALCGQETSNVVEIRLIATSQGGSLLGLDNNPNAVYCNSATFTGTFTTLGHPGNYSLRYSWAGNSNYISAPSGPAAGGSTGNTYGRIVIPFLGINAASSTGTIPFVFTNNTNATVNTTLSLYPRVHSWAVAGANGTGGFLCNGAIENHIIAIKPTPVATRNTAQNQSICSETAANISVRSNITDESTRFTWTSSNTTTIQGLPASGDTTVAVGGTFRLLQHLTSTNTTAQTTTITITPQLTSATCNPGAAVTYSITVNGNINPGVFTAEQTVCSGGDPAAFVETVPAAGTTASTPTYVWQSASGTCASPGTFGNISGQTGNEYDIPSGITATRSYRRIVTFVSGATCRDTTACVTIYVNTATAGSIATGSQTICAGSDPSEIGTVAPGSGAGSISYQWESKLGTGCTGLFADVFGANSETYTPPAGLASTTTYRRKTVSNLNGQDCASAVSNCFTVYINSVDAGGIANLTPNNQIFCGANDPVNLTSAPNAAGTATPTYQWQSSVGADCAGSFSNVPSAGTGFNYNPPLLNVTTTYRRIATSLLNSVPCRDTTTCETITILNINPGQIANTQAVCAGATAQPFISVTDATAGGSTDYRWESSTTGLAGSWTPIASTNSNVYTHPDVITGTLYFHRVTFGDISGTACDVATPSISVFLSDPTAGQVDAPLCTSLNPAAFTITTPATGPGGALTYTWERSPDGLAPWTTVTDSTRATLDLNGLSPGTSYYRRIITNTLITGYPCSVTGNIVTVNAYAGTAGDWTGLNGADWFNCANWGAGFVPDNTTPVNIPSVAFKPIINRTSAFITTTDSVAHAANLDVNDLLTFANSNDSLFIGGNLIIHGSGSVVMTTGGNLELRGHWTNNVGPTGFVQHSGNVSLTGASAQQHIFTPQTFDRLRINHTGTGITFDKDVIITDSIEFVNGKINTSASPDGLLTLSPTAKASGASNSSFVNGPMAKETNSTPAGSAEFTFPIGKTLPSNNYQPAGVLPVTHSSGTTTYTAEFIAADPSLLGYPFASTTLNGILHDKYWDIDRVGTGTARVVLNYQPTVATTTGIGGWVDAGGSTNMVPPPNSTNVAVAHGDGFWDFTKDDGYFEVTTAPFEAIWYKSSGKVYSGEMLSFSPFTIGFGSSTILPVKLLSFNGRILGTDGALSWKIADASDLAGFELQYSADGITFRKLADVPANGGTVYSYLDKQLPIGARYYRLLIKEKSGNSLFSKLLVLTLDGQRTSIVGLANTIVREQQVTGKIISAKSQGVRALVSDVSGRQIKEQKGHLQQGTNRWLIGTGYLAQGMYFVTIITDDGVKATLQFVKE